MGALLSFGSENPIEGAKSRGGYACVLVKHWGANDSVEMIYATQIEDEETLGQWLAVRPHSDACTIAARIALRLLPFVTNDIDMLQCLRSLLSANVWDGIPASRRRFAQVRFGTGPAGRIIVPGDGANKRRLSLAVTDIAGAALRAVYEPAMSSKFCIFAAENSLHVCSLYAATRTDNPASGAGLAAALNNVVWYEIIADARALENSAEPLEPIELWMLRSNAVFAGLAKEMEDGWVSDCNVWSFWHRWWRGAVSGQWLDWNLQREVALIPDDIWQQGPKAVMAAIAEIEARYALALTDNAETIEPDPETGRLILVPTSALPSDLGHYARRKMLKAVALLDDPACLQMYGGLSADLAMLRDAVADAENMPMELYDACASATRRLAVRASNGECPPPDKDAVLSDYLTRLREVAADILSHDPATQSVLERRNAITGNTALIDSAVAVQQATAKLLRVTAGHLAKSLPKDAALATDPTANPDDRKAAAFRWAGRFLRIGAWCVGASVGATYALGQTIVLAKDVLEALPIIQASPYYQQAMAAVLRLLNLG